MSESKPGVKRTVTTVLLTIVVCAVLVYCFFAAYNVRFCRRTVNISEVPVYSNSVLERESYSSVGTNGFIFLEYSSPDSPEKIQAFYEEIDPAYLALDTGENIYTGTVSFNTITFIVRVDLNSYADEGVTKYTLQIMWYPCDDTNKGEWS